MTICAADPIDTPPHAIRAVRVLRWTFRRHDDTVVCTLSLTNDESAYELRVDPTPNPAGIARERFADAMSAFERQGAIERALVDDGWLLEEFESAQVLRPA